MPPPRVNVDEHRSAGKRHNSAKLTARIRSRRRRGQTCVDQSEAHETHGAGCRRIGEDDHIPQRVALAEVAAEVLDLLSVLREQLDSQRGLVT
ncbi:MAG: hypothetical protein NZ693_08510 [Thermoflexales bacterium]|nr:hypothetical protein [Thermoflexales bacterium]